MDALNTQSAKASSIFNKIRPRTDRDLLPVQSQDCRCITKRLPQRTISGVTCNTIKQNSGCCCKTIQAGSWVPLSSGTASGLVYQGCFATKPRLFCLIAYTDQPRPSSLSGCASRAGRRTAVSRSALREILLALYHACQASIS